MILSRRVPGQVLAAAVAPLGIGPGALNRPARLGLAEAQRTASQPGSRYAIDTDGLNLQARFNVDVSREALSAMLVRPGADHQQNRQEILACRCQPVFLARWPLGVDAFLQQSGGRQRAEPLRQHCGRYPEVLPKLVEAGHPRVRISQDQDAPGVAHGFKATSNRTRQEGVCCPFHTKRVVTQYVFDSGLFLDRPSGRKRRTSHDPGK